MGSIVTFPGSNLKPKPGATVPPMTKAELRTFGGRVRFARASTGLSQKDFAASISLIAQSRCTKSLVCQWEKDKVKNPQNATLLAVAAITGFAPQWLVDGKGPQHATLPTLRIDSKDTETRSMLRRAIVIAASAHKTPAAIAEAAIQVFETLADEPAAPEAALKRIARQSKSPS